MEPAVARRNHVGTISLLCAVGGMVACRIGLLTGPFAGEPWLRLLAAGFEAATVGALADWFAVTALFRHPLGLPIPHTAIIPTRRAKIVESIANIGTSTEITGHAAPDRRCRVRRSSVRSCRP